MLLLLLLLLMLLCLLMNSEKRLFNTKEMQSLQNYSCEVDRWSSLTVGKSLRTIHSNR